MRENRIVRYRGERKRRNDVRQSGTARDSSEPSAEQSENTSVLYIFIGRRHVHAAVLLKLPRNKVCTRRPPLAPSNSDAWKVGPNGAATVQRPRGKRRFRGAEATPEKANGTTPAPEELQEGRTDHPSRICLGSGTWYNQWLQLFTKTFFRAAYADRCKQNKGT